VLADEIRRAGGVVAIDEDVDPPIGWSAWCEKQVIESDYIVIVCTKTYYEKVYAESYVPSGVKFEGHCIRADLYKSGMINHKVIPVILDRNSVDFIPLFIRSYSYYELFNIDSKEKFLVRVTSSRADKPPLPSEIDEDKFQRFETHLDRWNSIGEKLPQQVHYKVIERMASVLLSNLGYREDG